MRNVLERVLNLLAFLLTVGRPVPADEIRRTVAGYDQDNDEAFKRMFERDKDLIRRLGIPIHLRATGTFEVDHGYVIPPDEYRLPDPGLNDEERAALWLAAQVVRIGGETAGLEALLKLGGSQTTDAIEPFGAELGSEVDTLADLYQAIVGRNFVLLTYRDRSRKVAPHGLGHRMGHWYLAAVEEGDTKVYRVDRIEAVDIIEGDDAFARSPGVSVRQALAAHPWEAGSEARVSVVVRFDAEAAWWADRRLDPAVERRPAGDGGVEVTLQVAHLDAFIGWLLTFGAEAEVISPPEVREAVIDRVRGVA
jgi:predicted DNA-binding transcriptional regulator YafY